MAAKIATSTTTTTTTRGATPRRTGPSSGADTPKKGMSTVAASRKKSVAARPAGGSETANGSRAAENAGGVATDAEDPNADDTTEHKVRVRAWSFYAERVPADCVSVKCYGDAEEDEEEKGSSACSKAILPFELRIGRQPSGGAKQWYHAQHFAAAAKRMRCGVPADPTQLAGYEHLDDEDQGAVAAVLDSLAAGLRRTTAAASTPTSDRRREKAAAPVGLPATSHRTPPPSGAASAPTGATSARPPLTGPATVRTTKPSSSSSSSTHRSGVAPRTAATSAERKGDVVDSAESRPRQLEAPTALRSAPSLKKGALTVSELRAQLQSIEDGDD